MTLDEQKKIDALVEYPRAKAEEYGARAADSDPRKPEQNPEGAKMCYTAIDFLLSQQRQHQEWVATINGIVAREKANDLRGAQTKPEGVE